MRKFWQIALQSKEFKNSEKIFSLKARLWNFYRNDSEMTIPETDYEEIKLIKCNKYTKNVIFNEQLNK